MILESGHSSKYLSDFKDGKIAKGLGLGSELDEYLLFKRKQLNIILGHDNVGKSYWFEWYMLALSTQHNLKWCLWMGENSSGQVMRDLIQMYSGIDFKNLSHQEIRRYELKIEGWFTFVSNSKLYTPQELLNIFNTVDCDACFIDPFTGLERGMTHADNYQFLNEARQFCNTTGKTIYISTHPTSESGRNGMNYMPPHEWQGNLKPPMKAHIEGGKPFLNRCDDMIIIHRLVKHPTMKYTTLLDVEKIKDRDTGGKQTEVNKPLYFDYNYGKGFKIGGIDSVKRKDRDPIKIQEVLNREPVKADFSKIGQEVNEKKDVIKISDGGSYNIPDGYIF